MMIYQKLGIKTIVCDEVHNLRSKTTQKYKAVKNLQLLPSILVPNWSFRYSDLQ